MARMWPYGPDFIAEEAGKYGPLEFLGRRIGLTKLVGTVCIRAIVC